MLQLVVLLEGLITPVNIRKSEVYFAVRKYVYVSYLYFTFGGISYLIMIRE
jgi:hypothetical protein